MGKIICERITNLKEFSVKNTKLAILGVISGLANGLFGSGGGSIIVPGMQKLGIEQHKSHASAIAIILPLTVISTIVYLRTHRAEWAVIVWVSVGGTLGGLIGAKLLNKISGNLLHKIFGAFMIVAALRMIF